MVRPRLSWLYTYDAKGQLTSGKHYLADDTPIAGQQFEYDYDDIGNRTAVRTGGDAAGQNLREQTYAASLLNTYQQRAGDLDTADVIGTAPVDTHVQVNGQPATRQGEYFHHEVSADTSSSATLHPVTVAAVRPAAGPLGEDIVASESGTVFLPQTPETYFHDADGNLISDGRWTYTWDAADQLIEMVESPNIAGATTRRRLTFSYDYIGRRRAKSVYTWTGITWTLTRHTAFIYDGWNLITELEPTDLAHPTTTLATANRHTWGLDLSQTLQGAGGIGGLLITSPAATPAFPAYDGNGNLTALTTTLGTPAAAYTYAPFGEPLAATGPLATPNPIRFSTKYVDESGLGYWGYRYYAPETGRWISRDPLREAGGPNIFSYSANAPVDEVDPLGLTHTNYRAGRAVFGISADGRIRVGFIQESNTTNSRGRSSGWTEHHNGKVIWSPRLWPRDELTNEVIENRRGWVDEGYALQKEMKSSHTNVETLQILNSMYPCGDALDKQLLQGDTKGAVKSASIDIAITLATYGVGRLYKVYRAARAAKAARAARAAKAASTGWHASYYGGPAPDDIIKILDDLPSPSPSVGTATPTAVAAETCAVVPTSQVQIRLGGAIEEPGGRFRAGGFDPETNTVYLADGGHFDGMAKVGGSPSSSTPGLTMIEKDTRVYWSNDSQSLKKALTVEQRAEIQAALEEVFPDKSVEYVDTIFGNSNL